MGGAEAIAVTVGEGYLRRAKEFTVGLQVLAKLSSGSEDARG